MFYPKEIAPEIHDRYASYMKVQFEHAERRDVEYRAQAIPQVKKIPPQTPTQFKERVEEWINEVYVPASTEAPPRNMTQQFQAFQDKVAKAKLQINNRRIAGEKICKLFNENQTYEIDKANGNLDFREECMGRGLDLEGLGLTSLPSCVSLIKDLKRLSLRGNPIPFIGLSVIQNLVYLKELQVDKEDGIITDHYQEDLAEEEERMARELDYIHSPEVRNGGAPWLVAKTHCIPQEVKRRMSYHNLFIGTHDIYDFLVERIHKPWDYKKPEVAEAAFKNPYALTKTQSEMSAQNRSAAQPLERKVAKKQGVENTAVKPITSRPESLHFKSVKPEVKNEAWC